jgi:hypothetical protein
LVFDKVDDILKIFSSDFFVILADLLIVDWNGLLKGVVYGKYRRLVQLTPVIGLWKLSEVNALGQWQYYTRQHEIISRTALGASSFRKKAPSIDND